MKVRYKVNDKLELESEAPDQKGVFAFLASVSEIFGINQCGKCKSKDIRPVVRTAAKGKQTFEFFEYHCSACQSRLAFGQLSDGTGLFPKRKDEDGKWIENGGWTKFVAPKDE